MMREKWYWIELIGFDNESEDYGVNAFLERLTEAPFGISLLFSNLDFVNCHDNREREYVLKPCDCAYCGHKYSEERDRQNWTNFQLRGLVRELRGRGIKVVFSTFNFFTNANDDGSMYCGEFCTAHPEIWDLDPNGQPTYSVNMLKRLKNGNYYEDYLFGKIEEVLTYYGFDGMQVADGLSSARLSVQNGDCSDDLFDQFLAETKVEVPASVSLRCDGDAEQYRRRRDWIFGEKHFAWLKFLSDRWQTYYKKLVKAVAGKNRTLLFNSAWTRDPFEALYRYGIDYKKLSYNSFYAIMVEETSATMGILSPEDMGGVALEDAARRYYPYEFMLMQMSLKTYLPNLKQVSLAPINDTYEQWDILRHAPMEMQRAILRRGNCFVLNGANYEPVNSGPLYCMSDGIAANDWKYLEQNEALVPPEGIRSVLGFTLLQPENALYSELKNYIATRDYSSTALANCLMNAGLQIASAARVADIDAVKTPLLALNPQHWSAAERKKLAACKAPYVAISTEPLPNEGADFAAEGPYLHVAAYRFANFPGGGQLREKLIKAGQKRACAAGYYDEHGAIWTCPLRYNTVDGSYFTALAAHLNEAACFAAVVSQNGECKITVYEESCGRYRMLLSNDEYRYSLPTVRFPKPVRAVKSLTKYHGYEITITEQSFTVRVPPRGMEVLLIDCGEES